MFKVYTGKEAEGQDHTGLTKTTRLVLELASPYLDNGRSIYTDNYYTSLELTKALLQRSTHLTGTLRHRKGNPDSVKNQKLKRGEIISKENDDGIMIMKWRDKRDVTMLSTEHSPRMQETGKRNRNGEQIRKPEAVALYNKSKIGIDVSDQLGSYFSPLRKTIRWYHKVAFELILNTSITNALLLMNEKAPEHEKLQVVDFRESVCCVLLGIPMLTKRETAGKISHQLEKTKEREGGKENSVAIVMCNLSKKWEGILLRLKSQKYQLFVQRVPINLFCV